jgi:hypothetical protein
MPTSALPAAFRASHRQLWVACRCTWPGFDGQQNGAHRKFEARRPECAVQRSAASDRWAVLDGHQRSSVKGGFAACRQQPRFENVAVCSLRDSLSALLAQRLQFFQCLWPGLSCSMRSTTYDRPRLVPRASRSSSSWSNVSSPTPPVLPELMASSSASFEG